MPSDAATTIKGYPDIGLAAYHAGEETAYRLWLLIRALDDRGCGWVEERRLRDQIQAWQLWSDRTTRRTLARWEREWWFNRHGQICYASLERVCRRLQAAPRRRPVDVPLEHFGSIGPFRASCVGAWLAGKPRTVSNGKLAGFAGCTRRTIITHLQRIDAGSRPNYEITAAPARPGEALAPELAAAGYRRISMGGAVYVARQLPNTYRVPWTQGSRGMAKSVLRACSTGERDYRRVFHGEPAGAARAVRSLQPGESIYVRTEGSTTGDHGAIWTQYRRPHGGQSVAVVEGVVAP